MNSHKQLYKIMCYYVKKNFEVIRINKVFRLKYFLKIYLYPTLFQKEFKAGKFPEWM